jgi:hypothetical protein
VELLEPKERVQLSYKQEVRGSSPRPPTIRINNLRVGTNQKVVHLCSEFPEFCFIGRHLLIELFHRGSQAIGYCLRIDIHRGSRDASAFVDLSPYLRGENALRVYGGDTGRSSPLMPAFSAAGRSTSRCK